MQEAIPYKSWQPIYTKTNSNPPSSSSNIITTTRSTLSQNALVLFMVRGCCMGHVIRRLLLAHGVNPMVQEVSEEDKSLVLGELNNIFIINNGRKEEDNIVLEFPFVFIGGKFFGGLDKVMNSHICGELNLVLKQAGVLWL